MLMKAVEARKKAEVVHIHINKCRNTHTVHSIKRAEVIIPWMDSCFLSFLCALSLHSFFFFPSTYQVKRFWPSSTFPLNAQQH